jgi:lambda family phage portal protein
MLNPLQFLRQAYAAIDAFATRNMTPEERTDADRRGTSANPQFRGGQVTRHNRGWQPALTSGDDALRQAWPLLQGRTRDLIQNEPSVLSAKRKLITHIIGTGIQTFADARVADAVDEEYCDESDLWHKRWFESNEVDVEAKLTGFEMQRQSFGEETLGDCFLLECWDDHPRRSTPLCYQLLEAEQIDTSKDRPAGNNLNRIVRGIELDRFNRAVAYYVYDAHPYDSSSGWTSSSTRIPASRVLHSFVPFRPSATRGVNWYAAIIQAARDVDTLIDNELTASIIASLFTVVIKRATGQGSGFGLEGTGDDTSDGDGRPFSRLGKGIIADIGKDDEVEQVESKRPSPLLQSLVKLMRQQESMGIGLSEIRLTGDYSSSSYTSARGAHLDDQAVFEPLQYHFGSRIVLPMRQRHNDLAVGLGKVKSITARQYEQDLYRWRCFEVFPVGREQLDPEMETEASSARIRGGISTLRDECAARGLHWRHVLRQRKYETDKIREMGLENEINFSKGGGAPDQKANNDNNPGANDTPAQREARRQRLDGNQAGTLAQAHTTEAA